MYKTAALLQAPLIIALLLLTCMAAYAVDVRHRAPRNCLKVTRGEVEYAKMEVYVKSHADTAGLKKIGFREFEFLGWSVYSARYAAIFPRTQEFDSLPPGVTDVLFLIPGGTRSFLDDPNWGNNSAPVYRAVSNHYGYSFSRSWSRPGGT
jgi:hypothetical protein